MSDTPQPKVYTLEEIEAHLVGITPGEWKWVDHDLWSEMTNPAGIVILDDGSAGGEYTHQIAPDSPNGKLVAAAPAIIRQLLAMVKDGSK